MSTTPSPGVGRHRLQHADRQRGQVYEGRRGRDPDPDDHPIVRSSAATSWRAMPWTTTTARLASPCSGRSPTRSRAARPRHAPGRPDLRCHALQHRPAHDGRFPRGAATDLWRDDLDILSGHRDCFPTECPGDKLYTRLPAIREEVAARIGPAGPRARLTRGPGDRTSGQPIWCSGGRDSTARPSTAPASKGGARPMCRTPSCHSPVTCPMSGRSGDRGPARRLPRLHCRRMRVATTR